MGIKGITAAMCAGALTAVAIMTAAGGKAAAAGFTEGADEAPEIEEVWEAYDAFNSMYLDSVKCIYKNTDRDSAAIGRDRGAAAIWCQPMFADMALNAAALARKAGDEARAARYDSLAVNVLEGNIRHYLDLNTDKFDLDRGWFIYDDIQWWTITMARAYLATGNERYRRLAERSFARVWYGSPRVGDTGSYADPAKGLGGGMFWQWQPLVNPAANKATDGKMACINFPTVVAAMLLYQGVPPDRQADPAPEKWENGYGSFVRPHYETRERYLEMAKEIYDWSVAHIVDTVPGRVFDNSHDNNPSGDPLIYNQGTYIGASALLYLATGDRSYLDRACQGADYSINVMSAEHHLLPWAHNPGDPYNQGSLEQGIYPAIWAQYMKILIDDCGQRQCLPYIRRYAAEGWRHRLPVLGICDGESWKPTAPLGNVPLGSYSASTVPSLMLILPY